MTTLLYPDGRRLETFVTENDDAVFIRRGAEPTSIDEVAVWTPDGELRWMAVASVPRADAVGLEWNEEFEQYHLSYRGAACRWKPWDGSREPRAMGVGWGWEKGPTCSSIDEVVAWLRAHVDARIGAVQP